MDEQSTPQVVPFNARTDFTAQVKICLSGARHTLDLFDPDFSLFGLGSVEVDAILRVFVQGGGHMRLAMHQSTWLERECPRFIRLLRDCGHRIACRQTSRGLRQLTDSFCISDEADVVRRFHSDHARGEASFGVPGAADVCRERFAGIWEESTPTLHPTTTGL
ncbi:MAG: hypothetical protein M3Y65_00775 [Pseudomonadota bacterium]|nr:hypothetical protein [Pseudomonadota bacterium]